MPAETKPAFGGPNDGGEFPVVPERLIAFDLGTPGRYAIYEDVGLRYVFKGIETGCEAVDEKDD